MGMLIGLNGWKCRIREVGYGRIIYVVEDFSVADLHA